MPDCALAFRFVDFGDVQTGINEFKQNVFAINAKVPASVRSFITMTGDVTTDGTTTSWAAFKTAAAPLNINWSVNNPFQFFSAVGNHDSNNGVNTGWMSIWTSNLPAQVSYSAYADITADPNGRFGSYKYQNAIFVWVESPGYPSKPVNQETFLSGTLARAAADPQVTWKFVLFHYPPFACTAQKSDWTPGITWIDNYFLKNKVDLILTGDSHLYARSCPITNGASKTCDTNNRGKTLITNTTGVIQLTSGGGGTGLYPPGSCWWVDKIVQTHHFLDIDVAANSLHVVAWDTDYYADGTAVGSANPPSRTDFRIIDDFVIQKTTGASPFPSPSNAPSPTASLKPGDANGDGLVNKADLIIWAGNYAKLLNGVSYADFNNNGKVNGLDFGIWFGNFGK